MKKRLAERERLQHMVEALDEIEQAVAGYDLTRFEQDRFRQLAVIKLLENVGEAAYHVSPPTRAMNLSIEWTAIVGLRHILVHEYYDIRPKVIWRIVNHHTSQLKPEIQTLIENFPAD